MAKYLLNEEYLVEEGYLTMEELHQLHPTYIYQAENELWLNDRLKLYDLKEVDKNIFHDGYHEQDIIRKLKEQQR